MTTSKTFLNMLWHLLITLQIILAQETQISDKDKELYKGYSGYRLFDDSIQKVYHHDLTIAVVELNKNETMLNCELIEVFNDEQKNEALRDLAKQINKPISITFDEMMERISQCSNLDEHLINQKIAIISHKLSTSESDSTGVLSKPDTKWCGPGDTAKTYFDLGSETTIDKCCRAHDLCPVKVRGHSTRYDLTNGFFYTMSHCACDNELLRCLKASNKPTANSMANMYFNILKIRCIADNNEDGKKQFQPGERF